MALLLLLFLLQPDWPSQDAPVEAVDQVYLDYPGFYQRICVDGESGLSVWFRNVLFEDPGGPKCFFVEIFIRNDSEQDVWCDLRHYGYLLRPVQCLPSEDGQLDITSMPVPAYPEVTSEYLVELVQALNRGDLFAVPSGENRSYWVDCEGFLITDVTSFDAEYLFLGFNGWLGVMDEDHRGFILSHPDAYSFCRLSLPIRWDEIPSGAEVLSRASAGSSTLF